MTPGTKDRDHMGLEQTMDYDMECLIAFIEDEFLAPYDNLRMSGDSASEGIASHDTIADNISDRLGSITDAMDDVSTFVIMHTVLRRMTEIDSDVFDASQSAKTHAANASAEDADRLSHVYDELVTLSAELGSARRHAESRYDEISHARSQEHRHQLLRGW